MSDRDNKGNMNDIKVALIRYMKTIIKGKRKTKITQFNMDDIRITWMT